MLQPLVAEVFRLHPLDPAVALDDDWGVFFLVAEHSVPNALGNGVVNSFPVLPDDACDVFSRSDFHIVP